MTENNIHSRQSTVNNNIKNVNTTKLNMNDGKLNGNIVDETVDEGSVDCKSEILWFYCEENTQYLFSLC